MKTRCAMCVQVCALCLVYLLLMGVHQGSAHYRFPVSDDLIEIEIIGDDSGRFPLYPAPYGDSRESDQRWYLAARRG
ncbi:MAG TPA: hypothetical protein PKO06_13380, partial [Candidatus Ozemobacteraceae bacterium]|nr:hypothetical protein [Candidatus Ozemobacteraceae bacterium]